MDETKKKTTYIGHELWLANKKIIFYCSVFNLCKYFLHKDLYLKFEAWLKLTF